MPPIRSVWTRLLLAGALASAALGGCAALGEEARSADAAAAPVALSAEEAEVLKATNAFRAEQGLEALKPDAMLTAIARYRSSDMAKRQYFSHVDPDGADVFMLLRRQRFLYWAAGENLARNNYGPKDTVRVAMKGWIESPGHRANLAHPAFGRIGIGEARGQDGKLYFTQVFTD